MDIQWYPGHMAKARRQLQEELKLIDVVVELVDARAPQSSRNPDFDALFQGKERVILLNKADLADPALLKRWIAWYEGQGIRAAALDSTTGKAKNVAVSMVEKAAEPKVKRMREKGVLKVVRAMVVGIPNVGKSTLINRIAGAKRAAVGDRPGVTRSKQWVKITPYLELCDTPGLLWPKINDQEMAKNLAFLGSIRDEIMPLEQLACELSLRLMEIVPELFRKRYPNLPENLEEGTVLDAIARSRGCLMAGNEPDTERAAKMVLDEFRAGKIGRIVLETPEKNDAQEEA
ncbi:MAG: ribosome biogenesis GTPase YlqF [Clostridia bacterium]|nr:ribosome biogenesis GTPase YlqF [Clostridia bacterium]